MGAQHYLCVRFSIGDLPTVHVVCVQTMVLDKAQSRTSPHSIQERFADLVCHHEVQVAEEVAEVTCFVSKTE